MQATTDTLNLNREVNVGDKFYTAEITILRRVIFNQYQYATVINNEVVLLEPVIAERWIRNNPDVSILDCIFFAPASHTEFTQQCVKFINNVPMADNYGYERYYNKVS